MIQFNLIQCESFSDILWHLLWYSVKFSLTFALIQCEIFSDICSNTVWNFLWYIIKFSCSDTLQNLFSCSDISWTQNDQIPFSNPVSAAYIFYIYIHIGVAVLDHSQLNIWPWPAEVSTLLPHSHRAYCNNEISQVCWLLHIYHWDGCGSSTGVAPAPYI